MEETFNQLKKLRNSVIQTENLVSEIEEWKKKT